MSWSSRRNGIPRIGRTLPVPPLKDLSDQEYAEMVDQERERDHLALHGGCPVCGADIGVRCCEYGADPARGCRTI